MKEIIKAGHYSYKETTVLMYSNSTV